MKKFKYNVMELISCIQDRPCLWDKSLENYKDRLERREAWEQIFGILDEKYDEMPAEERRLMEETVIYKWTNIRDTFIKSLKTKTGRPKRKYMLHDQLKFLKKNLPEEDIEQEETPTEESYKKRETERTEIEVPIVKKKSRKKYSDRVYSYKTKDYGLRKRSRTKRYDDEDVTAAKNTEFCENDTDFVGADGESRLMNEDEAFFASLLPTVVKYDVDDKLEFRLGVLEVMKRIKDSKKWTIQ